MLVYQYTWGFPGDRGFPGGSAGKEPNCQCRRHKRLRFHPWVGRSPGKGSGNLVHYSCLENCVDREAWQATVHGVAELDTTEHTRTDTYNNILIVYTISEACTFVCMCVP